MVSFINRHPALTLLIFSPLLAEFASGNNPFFKFFSPWGIILGLGFYGLGALIIREIASYRKLNYFSIFLLGCAFGILEEGILLKSWFDPSWPGAAILSKSLNIGGFIPLQALMLIIYHAVLSILVPIMLVNSLVGSDRPLLTRKKFVLLILLFIIFGVLFSAGLGSKVKLMGWQFILTVTLFAIFGVLGLRQWKERVSNTPVKFSKLTVLGILFLPLLAINFWFLSGIGMHWTIIVLIATFFLGFYGNIFFKINWSQISKKEHFGVAVSFASGTIPFSAMIAMQSPDRFLNTLFAVIFTSILLLSYKKLSQDNA